MDRAYHLIRDADFISFAFTAWLVFYVGIRASARHRTVDTLAIWISALTFLTYIAMAISIDGYEPLEWIAAYVLRGGCAAGMIVGAFCFAGSFAVRTWQFIAPIPRYFRERNAAVRRLAKAEARRRQEELDHSRNSEQLQRQHEESDRRAEEYQRIKAETTKREALEQRRRTDARAECELCYSEHIPEVAQRFSRSLVHAFMAQYMGNDQPADAVELRGKQLQRIISHHSRASQPPKQATSIQEITDWFLVEKQRIVALPVNDEMREFHLVQLNIRYAELTQTMLEAMNP